MSNKVEFLGKINVGKKLEIDNHNRKVLDYQLAFFSENQEVIIIIQKYDEKKYKAEKRTEQQNKYYHKLLDIICEHTGDEHMDLHENLKCMFLSRPWVKADKEYLVVKSTRDLKPKEFGNYLEQVFKWASEEFGLILPESKNYYD